MSLIALMINVAIAAEVVLTPSPDPEALDRAARVTGADRDALELQTLSGLFPTPEPRLLAGGTLTTCTDAAAGSLRLVEQRDAIRRAIRAVDHSRAQTLAEEFTALLPCLDEPLVSEVAGQVYLYSGYLAGLEGREEDARAAFRQSAVFHPELQWDTTYAPDNAPLFYAERDGLRDGPRVPLALLPAPDRLRVNGRMLEPEGGAIELPAGRHVVQLEDGQTPSLLVDVDTSSALLLPGTVRDELILQVTDPASWGSLDALLSAALPADTEVLAVIDRTVYQGRVGAASWEVQDGRMVRGRILRWTGGALLSGGLLLTAAGQLSGRSAATDAQSALAALDHEAYLEAEASYGSARGGVVVGGVLIGSGAVTLGLGLLQPTAAQRMKMGRGMGR